jgi:hypothetical protein
VFKVWDKVLVDFGKYFEKHEQTYRNGVDFDLKTFEQELDKVNEEYSLCNDKAKMRFVEQSESVSKH